MDKNTAVPAQSQEPVAWFIADDNGEVYRATGYEHERDQWRAVGHEVYPLYAAPQPAQTAHPDDLAVDIFAAAMKEKLAQARAKGRGGWQQCDPTELSIMLREHVEKGDPRDVANFCMFLWCLGQPISDAALPMGKRATAASQSGKSMHEKVLDALKVADRFCDSLTSEVCPDDVAIPIKDALRALTLASPQPAQTARALPDATIEATSALIANSLLGAAPEEDVREVERLINEMLGRT